MGVLGVCLRANGKADESLDILNKAIELNPDYAEAYINRGLIRLSQENKPEALVELELAHRLKPHINQIWDLVVGLKVEAQDYSDAILLLINMIEIDPNWEKGFSLLVACNQKADESALAVKSFEKVLEVKPGSAAMHVNLGIALTKQGETKTAIANFKKGDSARMQQMAQGWDQDSVIIQAVRSGKQGAMGFMVRYHRRERGGILTHASILTATSNPTRTSPVKRGKWILEQILGSPPPPAPPSVPTLEGQQLKGNLRQRMEQHLADPACASCHSRMDAIGFAFERFDAVGQVRQTDEGQPIDPAGKLPDGRAFAGAGELKKLLLADKEKVVRNLSSKLLTFGLGRGLDYYDGPAVDKITEAALKADGRFSALVLGVVQSDPFRLRRGTSQVESGSEPLKK